MDVQTKPERRVMWPARCAVRHSFGSVKLESRAPEENSLRSLQLYTMGVRFLRSLHAGQPVNADSAACRVAPQLDELLNREDTSEVLNRPAVLDVASLD